jgi:hypothetical protein
MNELDIEKKKQVIGLYGEMQLSMVLHEKGWQVHRSYIDESIDFTITKYYCPLCKKYSNQLIRRKIYIKENGKEEERKCVTNLCEHCKKTELIVVSRYLQVKTSEGVESSEVNIRNFSFHPKIRYDMGSDVFYVWIAVFENEGEINNKFCHFYIFNTKDVNLFDDTSIDCYQITDNQKTTLKINKEGTVLNKGKKYDYSCFNNIFFDNFQVLE